MDRDIEKRPSVEVDSASSPSPPVTAATDLPNDSVWKRWNRRIEGLAGFEAGGIDRVPPEQRQRPSAMGILQMLLLWFSANLTINNLAVALTGPLLFQLGFLDSAMCAVFGTVLGAATTAYMSTWGPVSGNRTMVVSRYFMGYYPSKICTFLNIVLMVGYCTIDCIIAGQVLSAVSGGIMSIAVGIVIIAVIMAVISAFGLKVFHVYERFAWLPQLLVLFILIGSAGPHFNAGLQSSVSGKTLAANRLSFFSLMFYVPNSWSAAGSDYYVYYPVDTPKWKTFVLTFLGLTLSFCFVDLLGVGLAAGALARPEWDKAITVSSGALISAGFSPLGAFGKACSVVVAFSSVANCVPGTYSAAIDCQIMGRWGQRVPRWVWAVLLSILQMVLALAGRNDLFLIFTKFLALMAYWLTFMICIFIEEQVIFKPTLDWEAWYDRSKMPIGIAALTAFLLGWVGAVLGMYQVYFVGPLAVASGYADIGVWVESGFTLLTYPLLRYLERKKFGR